MYAQWRSCSRCQMIFLPPDDDLAQPNCPTCRRSQPPTAEDPGAFAWHYIENKKKVGPVSFARLQELAVAGTFKTDDMLLQSGSGKWTPAGEIPGLFPDAKAPVALPYDGNAEDIPTAEENPAQAETALSGAAANADEPPEWYFMDDQNKKVGPTGLDVLRELVSLGWLRPTFMLQPKGSDAWVMALTIEGLFPTESEPVPDPVPVAATPVIAPAFPPPPDPIPVAVVAEPVPPPPLPEPVPLLAPATLETALALATPPRVETGAMSPPPVADAPPEPAAMESPPVLQTPVEAIPVATVAVVSDDNRPAAPMCSSSEQQTEGNHAPPPLPTPIATTQGLAIAVEAPVPAHARLQTISLPQRFEPQGTPEEIAARFRSAWWQGKRPELDDYLPSDPEKRRIALPKMAQIDLECRLNCKENVRVETYLEKYAELTGDRSALLDLIEFEFNHRRRGQPGLALDEYTQRFPQFGAELNERLKPPAPSASPSASSLISSTDSKLAENTPAQIESPIPPSVSRPEPPTQPEPQDEVMQYTLQFAREHPIEAGIIAGYILLAIFVCLGVLMPGGKSRRANPAPVVIDAAKREPAAGMELEKALAAQQLAERETAAVLAREQSARAEAAKAREREQQARDNELRALEREKIARENEQKARADEKKAMEEAIRARAALEMSTQLSHRQLAEQWEKAGVWLAAVHHLSRLIELSPNDEKLWLRRAQANQRQADWLAAAADYARAAEIKPDAATRRLGDECLRRSLPVRTGTTIGLGAGGTLLTFPALLDLVVSPAQINRVSTP